MPPMAALRNREREQEQEQKPVQALVQEPVLELEEDLRVVAWEKVLEQESKLVQE